MPSRICRFDEDHSAQARAEKGKRVVSAHASAVLGGISIRETLTDLGYRPRKALGQHFLAQPSIAERMAELANVAGKRAVEVGPGLGVLTQFLLNADKLWLIEIDPTLGARLSKVLCTSTHVRIWITDALTVPWSTFVPEVAPVSLVGNLPYNIATALLERWLEVPYGIEKIVVMVQEEVADRLRAHPGSRHYSALSVLTQAVSRVHKGFRVAPGAFVPPPKVQSQVIVLEPDPLLRQRVADFRCFRKVVRTLFQQRRKQLRNSLAQLTSKPAEVLAAASVNAHARPQDLTVEDFFRLTNALSTYARVT